MGNLFQELKRRKVFRVAVVYAVVAWLLIQVAATVLPALQLPQWTVTFFTVFFILGFPVAVLLAWAYEVKPEGVKSDPVNRAQQSDSQSLDRKLIYATFVLVLLVAGFQVAERFYFSDRQAATANRSVVADPPLALSNSFKGSIELGHPLASPPGTLLSPPRALTRTFFSLTADGSSLIYTNYQSDETHQLLIRNLTTQETRVLFEGDLISGRPQISPDGTRVSINTVSELIIVNIDSGLVQPMGVDVPSYHPAEWLSDDEVIYTAGDVTLRRISLMDNSDSSFGDGVLGNSPCMLPGGRAFLFASTTGVRANANRADIKIHDMSSGSTKTLISGGYEPRFAASGHVTFIRNGDLWAVPFDLESLEITGPDVQVVSDVHSQPASYSSSYTFSRSGRLIYLAGSGSTEEIPLTRNWRWVDRSGKTENVPLSSGFYMDPEISPDGRSLAISKVERDGTRDIWIHDIDNRTIGRRTFTDDAHNPIWSPDGSRLFYQVGPSNEPASIWSIKSDGPSNPEIVYADPGKTLAPSSLTSDGEQLLYLEGTLGSRSLNVLTSRNNTWISSSVIDSQFNTWSAKVSPNGRWIAYDSNQNGKYDVYVNSYPELKTPQQVSVQSGREPKWGANGDELFYLREDGTLMSAKVKAETDFSWEAPVPLLSGFSFNNINTPNYAVSLDGQRFVQRQDVFERDVIVDETTPAILTIFENWFEELKRLAPPDPQ